MASLKVPRMCHVTCTSSGTSAESTSLTKDSASGLMERSATSSEYLASLLLYYITTWKELDIPRKRSDNNCMMNEMSEYEKLVLAVRDDVASVSMEENFEYNLEIYLEGLRSDVIEAKDA